MTVPQRILDKIHETDTGCWEWMASRNSGGYGVAWFEGRLVLAHRLMYSAFVEEIPAGLVVDHLCRNPACVNPDHLEAVTQRENIRRGESFFGKNSRKTHCVHGHEFTPENTTIYYGLRSCTTCRAARNKDTSRNHKRSARRAAARAEKADLPA